MINPLIRLLTLVRQIITKLSTYSHYIPCFPFRLHDPVKKVSQWGQRLPAHSPVICVHHSHGQVSQVRGLGIVICTRRLTSSIDLLQTDFQKWIQELKWWIMQVTVLQQPSLACTASNMASPRSSASEVDDEHPRGIHLILSCLRQMFHIISICTSICSYYIHIPIWISSNYNFHSITLHTAFNTLSFTFVCLLHWT